MYTHVPPNMIDCDSLMTTQPLLKFCRRRIINVCINFFENCQVTNCLLYFLSLFMTDVSNCRVCSTIITTLHRKLTFTNQNRVIVKVRKKLRTAVITIYFSSKGSFDTDRHSFSNCCQIINLLSV